MTGGNKPASRVRVGMAADEVLKLRGRSLDDSIGEPTVVAHNGDGFVAEIVWHYLDADVVLRHDGSRFRVADVRGVIRGG
jgi:hypothetical protein